MAFERPCLVFADTDGNIYDDPDFHMLAMDASGFGLPRPDDITPLPDHCPMALLPARYALGLDPATGETVAHEGLAVAALVPDNYVVTGLPAAYTENTTPDFPGVPPMPYAAVGFAHNRFYICAKKIDEASRFSAQAVAAKKIKKAGKALKTLYPENRMVAHLVEQCALGNDCWGAKNFCLGLPEMVLPIHPLACKNETFSPQGNTPFEPTPKELVEVMLHHAKANDPSIIYFTHARGQNDPAACETMLEALTLFRHQGGKATTILHSSKAFSPVLEPFARAGLSGIHYTLSGCTDTPIDLTIAGEAPKSVEGTDFPDNLFEEAKTLGMQSMLQYEYFPGMSDADTEMSKLIALLTTHSINHLLLGNLPNDPQKFCQALRGVDKGPVAGFGNFFKRIKKECPFVTITSAVPFCKNL